MEKIFGVLAAIAFITAVYFGSRDWLLLLVIIPFSLAAFSLGTRFFCPEFGFSGVIFVCVFFLLYFNSKQPLWGDNYEKRLTLEAIKSEARESEVDKLNKISKANERVSGLLKDPSSAKFSGEFVSDSGAVCGYVNGRNSLGAYAGSRKYIFLRWAAYLDDDSQQFKEMWVSSCN